MAQILIAYSGAGIIGIESSLHYSSDWLPNKLLKITLRSTVCVPSGGLDDGYHTFGSFDVYSMFLTVCSWLHIKRLRMGSG